LGALFLASVAAAWLALRGREPSIASGAFAGYNLLLVTVDTLRADRLGSYGSGAGLSPHLDRLADEGIRFDRVLSHVPLTLPSHVSLFTAMYPPEHGVRDNGAFRFGETLPTLATVLENAGYETAAFVGAFVLDARFGLNRGFDLYDDFYGEKRGLLSFVQLERPADRVLGPAESWIEARTGGPWFVWIHLYDPHAPYEAPRRFQEKFSSDPYGAEVAFVDDALGGFVERLAASGRLDRTLLAVVGDHGESLGEHGERTHGTFAYDSTLRVPWILWAKTLRPQVFEEAVRHVDVMPTLVDLLGVSPPERIAGQSLRPYLSGERRYDPPPHYFEALNTHLARDWAPLAGVVHEGHKLVRLPIPELYDLKRDPGETENLYRQKTGLAERLEETLEKIAPDRAALEVSRPDRETVENLRSLGYLVAPVESRKAKYTPEDDPKNLVDISNAYDDATALFGKGQSAEAIALFEEIVRKQPRSSEAHQSLAYALHQTGRIAEAISVLESAVERGLSDAPLLRLLGAYLLDSGKVDRAAALLEDLVRRQPEDAEARNTLGVAYGRIGRYQEARRELDRALALDPSSASICNNLGSLALSQGHYEEAVQLFGQALSLDPGHGAAWNGLGFAQARLGKMPKALESWRRAVESDPQQFDALYNLALALVEISPRESLPYLERFAREAPPQRYGADIEKVRSLVRSLNSHP
jgi:arylsulfatase A-like enzyme/Flp pilus assembly protein TadD